MRRVRMSNEDLSLHFWRRRLERLSTDQLLKEYDEFGKRKLPRFVGLDIRITGPFVVYECKRYALMAAELRHREAQPTSPRPTTGGAPL